MQTDIIDKQA